MSTISAYEKMFKDGSAFKPIKIEQPTPENPNGGMGGYDPDRQPDPSLFEKHMDRDMDQKIEEAKRRKKLKNGDVINDDQPVRPAPIVKTDNKKIKELERRISMLENALQLVMETQTKLLKED